MLENIVLLTNVIIGWDVILIEFLVVLGIALVLSILFGVVAFSRYKKCIKALQTKNWNYIVQQKVALKHISRVKNSHMHDDCMYMLAVANFELHNDQQFLANIETLNSAKYIPFKLYLKANYLIVTSNNVTSELEDVLKKLSLLNDENAKKCFAISNLLYKIKFEDHACASEEIETIKGMISERIKKVFLK